MVRSVLAGLLLLNLALWSGILAQSDRCYSPLVTGCYDNFEVLILRYYYSHQHKDCRSSFHCKGDWSRHGFDSKEECNSNCPGQGTVINQLHGVTEPNGATQSLVGTPQSFRPQTKTGFTRGPFTRTTASLLRGGSNDRIPNWQRISGINRYGKAEYDCGVVHATRRNVKTVERCASFCDEDITCQSITYNSADENCFLKRPCNSDRQTVAPDHERWVKLYGLDPLIRSTTPTAAKPRTTRLLVASSRQTPASTRRTTTVESTLARFYQLNGFCNAPVITSFDGVAQAENCARRCEQWSGSGPCQGFTFYPAERQCDLISRCRSAIISGRATTWIRLYL